MSIIFNWTVFQLKMLAIIFNWAGFQLKTLSIIFNLMSFKLKMLTVFFNLKFIQIKAIGFSLTRMVRVTSITNHYYLYPYLLKTNDFLPNS